MFSANPEQINAFKSNIDAIMTLSRITLSSTERLAALNLSTARAALDDGSAAANALVQIKDVKELAALRSPLSGPAMEKTVAYLRQRAGNRCRGAGRDLQAHERVPLDTWQGLDCQRGLGLGL
jgi:phasin family protein